MPNWILPKNWSVFPCFSFTDGQFFILFAKWESAKINWLYSRAFYFQWSIFRSFCQMRFGRKKLIPPLFIFQLPPLNGHNTLSGGSGSRSGSLAGTDRASLCSTTGGGNNGYPHSSYYPAGYPVQFDENEYAHQDQQQHGGEAVVVNQYRSVVKELVDAKLWKVSKIEKCKWTPKKSWRAWAE